jgi:hypothetical protein
MFTNPDLATQLARAHHRQMMAAASQRQLQHQQDRQASRTAGAAAKIIRRLATLIAAPGVPVQPAQPGDSN